MPLFDQYGAPIRPTGYQKVEGNGKGRSKYREYDPMTGILREITFNDDGTVTSRRWQNVQAIADANKLFQDQFKKNPKTGMQRQVALPVEIHREFMEKCGWSPGKNAADYDRKKFDQLINDSDYAKFKSRPGRVSVQTHKWV